LNNRYVAIAAVVVVVILGLGIFILATPGTRSTSGTSSSSASTPSGSSSSLSSSSTPSSSSSSSVATNGYYFLVFTQKGIAELTSPDNGAVLGYTRIFNISDSVPTQTFYWEGYPVQGATQSNFMVPLNNGTVEVVNSTSLKVTGRISVGNATGFIGVAVSPDQQYAAIADGPSGIVEVVKLATLQTVWKQAFTQPSGATAFPCDIRWSPDQGTVVVPMKNNGTIDVLSGTTGDIVASAVLPISSQPFMLSVNTQGSMLAVELSGNKTDDFFSYPALKSLGRTSFSIQTFSPTRGVFTPDGDYYLEASGATNVIEVISTSTFTVVNTINLPASASPGLADMEVTPDGVNAYVVMHGTPTTGGIIYLIPLATAATALGPSGSIPLTTAPAFTIPISTQFGTYLADNVLSPPVTGLHC
jgi:DNA-binding beta-propeller fold protein YncE